MLTGILFVLRSDISWEMLPHKMTSAGGKPNLH
ncbi:transposase [Paraburkholderia xenovorans]